MPNKTIELTFSHNIDISDTGKSEYDMLFIIARNYNNHKMSLKGRNGESCDVCISTKYMRYLSKFLIETADIIDKDPDFKKP